MDHQACLRSLPGHASILPELEGNAGFQTLDENEEFLLLSMAEITDEPVSPSLKTVMDKGNEPGFTERPKYSTAPLVMERPKSSAINVADVSFTKPLRRGRNIPFLASAKQTSAKQTSQNSTPTDNLYENVASPNTEQDINNTG